MDSISFLYLNSVCLFLSYYHHLFYYLIEVEYDGKQDEKDQHKNKMKEIDKIETFRKMKEDLGKFKLNQII